jgi:hypothetical protein
MRDDTLRLWKEDIHRHLDCPLSQDKKKQEGMEWKFIWAHTVVISTFK